MDRALGTVLRVQGLSFSYPQRHVFTDWSHNFFAGLTWVKGSNGCGKSTLLKLLAGSFTPLAGVIEVCGVNVTSQPLQYRQQVFHCGPGQIAFDHLSPVEFFGFMRSLYPSLDEDRLVTNVEGFGLHPFLEFSLSSLSTGTQRKVWLSIALAAGTKVTLLDEPFNALDAKSLEYLRLALGNCAQDTSCGWIVASHEDFGLGLLIAEILAMSIPGEVNSGPVQS